MQRRRFTGLNYSLGNEDYVVESMLAPFAAEKVVCVAASGAGLIPILATHPKSLVLVDMSEAQLAFAELRLRTLEYLDYDAFLQFWGYPPYLGSGHAEFREAVFADIKFCDAGRKLLVGDAMRAYADESPLHIGKWNRTTKTLSRIYRMLLGRNTLSVFECRTSDEQRAFLESHLSQMRLDWMISFAAILAKTYCFFCPGKMPSGAVHGNFRNEYARIFNALLLETLARQNFFLQLLLLGNVVHAEALPPEANSETFAKAKAWASHCHVEFFHGDVVTHLMNSSGINFVSLSNVPSYFAGDLSSDYLQRIRTGLAARAQVLVRTFLADPRPINTDGFVDLSSQSKTVFANECTKIYTMRLFERL